MNVYIAASRFFFVVRQVVADPNSLSRESAGARLLGLRVRIPPAAWMSVSCKYCVLSGRGLCVGLITRLEESGRL
jgi:hypothetical protein